MKYKKKVLRTCAHVYCVWHDEIFSCFTIVCLISTLKRVSIEVIRLFHTFSSIIMPEDFRTVSF